MGTGIGFFLTILLFCCGSPASAQELSSPWLGTHFLVALPDTVTNRRGNIRTFPDNSPELILFTLEETNVTVSGPSGSRSLLLRPDASALLLFSEFFPAGTTPYVDQVGLPVRKSLKIRSEKPIWIYCRFLSPFGAEMFSPIPVEKWGSEYRVGTLRNDPLLKHVGINDMNEEGVESDDAPGQVLVIASEDNTSISIAASTPLNGSDNVVLNSGEAYLVQTRRPLNNQDIAPRDLTGSLVTADKPVAVVGGNTRMFGGMTAYRLEAPTTNSARNLLAEWLLPVAALGRTFVYTPMMTEFPDAEELIRIVGVEPGVTEVRTSFGGPPLTVNQGEFIEMRSPEWRPGSEPTPFVIFSDKDILVYAISGSWAERLSDPNGLEYGGIYAWSPAMTLLPSTENWLTVGRFRSFPVPASVDQYVIVAAEKDAVVALDGEELQLDAVGATGFKWGRFKVEGGDHTLFATGGTFSGILYGIRSGYEAYRVPGIDPKEDQLPKVAHFALYEEDLSIAWATPVAGGAIQGEPKPDSLEIDRRDYCDSTVVTVDRIAENIWLLGPMTVELEPGSINTRMTVDTNAGLGPVLGYRVTLLPVDPLADASALLVVKAAGVERKIPFDYPGTMVTLPLRIDFGVGLTTGTEYRQTIELKNRRSFTASVIDAKMEKGTEGITIDDNGLLPRTLLSGQAVSIDVVFRGPTPGKTWRDTLLVFTDCGTYRVPVEGRTSGTPPPEPRPTITGYDWRTRAVGSRNDTLSFAGNAGTGGYAIREVRIVSTGSTPFSLVPPLHNRDSVRPGDTFPLGIRFAPTFPGVYLDTILLVTDAGDTARAELIGRAIDTSAGLPRLEGVDIELSSFCVGDRLDTFLVVGNPGTATATITDVQVIRATNGTLNFVALNLPRTIPPGGTLQLPLQFRANGAGAFEVLIGVDTGSGGEGIVLRVSGVAVECEPPALVVNDHDFGTIWITTEKEGSVTIRNIGRGDVGVLEAMLLNDAERSFAYLDPSPPFIVPEGDSVIVRASFSPPTVGRKDGAILFNTEIGELRAGLTGVGKKLVIPAFIRRDYKGMPGEEVVIDVEIEAPADSVYPERISYTVRFAEELLDPLGTVSTVGVDLPQLGTGVLSGVVHRPSDSLLGEGTIVSLRFLTRLSLLESTELPFELEADRLWIEFDERPGLLVKLPICGLEQRLFDFTRFGLSIGFPEPNPASDEVLFPFEIPFDGMTRVVVFDLLGYERLVAIDRFLVAGSYDLSIPVSLLPAGTYILHFRSGQFSATRRLEVRR